MKTIKELLKLRYKDLTEQDTLRIIENAAESKCCAYRTLGYTTTIFQGIKIHSTCFQKSPLSESKNRKVVDATYDYQHHYAYLSLAAELGFSESTNRAIRDAVEKDSQASKKMRNDRDIDQQLEIRFDSALAQIEKERNYIMSEIDTRTLERFKSGWAQKHEIVDVTAKIIRTKFNLEAPDRCERLNHLDTNESFEAMKEFDKTRFPAESTFDLTETDDRIGFLIELTYGNIHVAGFAPFIAKV